MELYFPLILDGATGTELQKRGYANEECAESWVLHHPETIIEIQKNYVEAGSNIVYAPTFGANRVKLEENGIFNQVKTYNKDLAAISKQAVGKQAFVAADIAPTGKFLAPLGDTPFDEMVEIYKEQAQALEDANVDLFVIETMMTVPDARAAVLAIKSVSNKPVFVSFTCDKDGKTLTGTDVTAALMIMQGMGVDAFGLNCSVGPEDMLVQLKRLAEYAEVPLIAKPNAGTPVVVDGKTTFQLKADEFATFLPEFIDTGVCIFGGCCGSDESFIKVIADTVKGAKMITPTSFEEKFPNMLPIATEKEVTLLTADTAISTIVPCDENLAEAIEDAEESNDPILAIEIKSMEEIDEFANNQFAITKPLCIVTEDAEVLEEALKLYQGRPMYEGSLDEKVLQPLAKKYGVVY